MDQTELKWLAVIGIKAEIARLGMLVKELEGEMIGPPAPAATADDRPRKKRAPMSMAARKAISRRMKARWAEKKRLAR
jgi:hypothetical protein